MTQCTPQITASSARRISAERWEWTSATGWSTASACDATGAIASGATPVTSGVAGSAEMGPGRGPAADLLEVGEARLPGPLLPREYAHGHDAVEAEVPERPEQR